MCFVTLWWQSQTQCISILCKYESIVTTNGAKKVGCSWREKASKKLQDKEQDEQKGLPIGRTSYQIPQKDEWENWRQDKQCLARKGGVRRLKHQQWLRKDGEDRSLCSDLSHQRALQPGHPDLGSSGPPKTMVIIVTYTASAPGHGVVTTNFRHNC